MSKWISADSIINKFNSHVGFTTCADVERAIKLIQDEPSIDIVRCKDCKSWRSDGGALMLCEISQSLTLEDDYCSFGERKSDE